ncbi:hypothetical protein [Marisediminicola sp. LYQ85]|uniref:hypothetical protein n=1 Tax=Marisediminicola sp. LYQ85 TaxID=3391062 RepID=UPI003983919A
MTWASGLKTVSRGTPGISHLMNSTGILGAPVLDGGHADPRLDEQHAEAPTVEDRKFVWRSRVSNARGRCYGEIQIRALMCGGVADGQEFFIEDERPGSPWAQVIVDGKSKLVAVEVGRMGADELLALVLTGKPDSQVEVAAPWNAADVAPVHEHGLLPPEVGAHAVWCWLNEREVDPMLSMRAIIPGPHRRN